ncbi:fatty acid-binding protein-like [Crassostrea virginica]|uniref:Fatty acid-binding protein-like n=1 Tax=Crassostrea virginica TaxID=6565 RepID=A0A8B8BN71_CRAVI|nr:fatty acid-binding protein-like [Crassostrea virginica]
MAAFVGTWEDTGERENFEEFAKAMGQTPETTEMFRKVRNTLRYTVDGDTWTMCLTSSAQPGKEKVYTYRIGQEMKDTALDGKEIKNVITKVSENEMREEMKVKTDDSWTDYKLTRKVDGDTMTTTVSAFGQTMITKQRRK